MGGGHNDYGGNEIYAFDVGKLSWSRYWGPSPNIPSTNGSCNETYSDGNPASRHTYDGVEYLPNVDRLWVNGGSLYCGAGNSGQATWHFNMGSRVWERQTDAPDNQRLEMVSAYDSVTKKVFVAGPASWLVLREFDPVANAWKMRGGSNATIDSGQNAAIDLKERKMVVMGRGSMYTFDLAQAGTIQRQTPTIIGDTSIVNANFPGLDYDPMGERLVAWSGGADVYTLDLQTHRWTRVSPAPTNTVAPTAAAESGTNGRFRYIPAWNVFIVVNSIDQNVYLYRLSPGTGTGADIVPPISPKGLKVR
jgi:hypothetical protein